MIPVERERSRRGKRDGEGPHHTEELSRCSVCVERQRGRRSMAVARALVRGGARARLCG